MPNTFGPDVIGAEQFAKAVESEKSGSEIFGKRVTGVATPTPTADQAAKSQSQFGMLVANSVQPSGLTGKGGKAPGDKGSLSVKELENVLNENPTFFDSLYEAEHARADGPRKEAVVILRNFEVGIKGAGRRHIIDEMNGILGQGGVDKKALGERARALGKQLTEQLERQEENALLGDADRVKALAEREENLKRVDEAKKSRSKKGPSKAGEPGSESGTPEQPSLSATQAGEEGQEQPGDDTPGAVRSHEEGATRPESSTKSDGGGDAGQSHQAGGKKRGRGKRATK